MDVAITGARGFVGQRLVQRLMARGDRVVAVDRPDATVPGCTVLPAVDTVTDGLVAGLEGVDVLVHLAARYVRHAGPEDVGPLLQSNVVFGGVVLDAAARAGVPRFVVADSAFAHQPPDGTGAVGLYGATRQALGRIAAHHAASGVEVVQLVVHDVYGPHDDKPRLVPTLLRHLHSGTRATVVGAPVALSLVHVDDVVDAFLAGIDGAPVGVWSVAADAVVTPAEVADRLEAVAGRPLPRDTVDPPATVPSVWDGPRLPGWAPTIGLDEGLAALVGS